MLNKVLYEHSPLPVPGSEQAKALAKELILNYQSWRDASSELRTKIWPACDRAFLGLRSLPKAPGFHWVDKGDLGETDLWDALRMIAEGAVLSLMPRDMSWLSSVPLEAEEQAVANVFRDYQIYKHRQGGTRQGYYIHILQLLARGSSAITWRWEQLVGWRRKSLAQQLAAAIPQVMDPAREMLGETFNLDPAGIDPAMLVPPDLVNMLAMAEPEREEFTKFDGPVVRCLDMQDVFLDPACNPADIDNPMCVMVYKTLEELRNAVDEDGNHVYSDLEQLQEKTLNQIWTGTVSNRFDSSKYLGVSHGNINKGSKYIPVLIFHRPVQVLGSDKWLDSYFYVALAGEGGATLIRAHENPLDNGQRTTFVDTYQDHYSSCAYGISAVEKSLPAFNQKCVVASLTLNAQVQSVFPGMNIVANMCVDDRKPVAGPGQFNFVVYKPGLGPNFMAPIPSANAGALLGMQAQQFLGQKILGQTGAVGGALGLDPSRNIEQSKTATQIDTESSSSSIGRDNLLEKISLNSLEPLCQGIADAAGQYAKGDVINFIVEAEGQAAEKTITKLQLGKRRKVIVTGYHGLQQKSKEVADLTKALQVIGQGNGMQYLGAGGPIMLRDIMLKLLGRFGVKDLDKYKLPDLELIQQTPGGQQFIAQLQQQTVQAVLQMAQVPPEVGQAIMQQFAAHAQQMQQEGGQQAA